MKKSKPRKRRLIILSLLGMVTVIVITCGIIYFDSPVTSMQRIKKELPAVRQFLHDSANSVTVLFDMQKRIKTSAYEFVVCLDEEGSELVIMSSVGSSYSRYYIGGKYTNSDVEITFYDEELDALDNILRKLGNYGWRSICIGANEISIEYKSIMGAELTLTSNAPLRINSEKEYSEQTDCGLFIHIFCWSAWSGKQL